MKKLDVYHHLPYPLKVLGASIWGYYLEGWRYGPETDQMVEDVLEHESWSHEMIRVYQEEQLGMILHHAASRIPFYKNQWDKRRRYGDKATWEILENWPVLIKADLREKLSLFLDEHSNRKNFYKEHTSGSTGTPLTLWQSRKTLHHWYALYEARIRKWNHVSRDDRWAIIGGQMVARYSQKKPPFWVWNQAFHQLYLSSYHISEINAESYLSVLKKYQIRYILGYPSSLTTLSELALKQGLVVPSMEVVISNAEPLFDYQRSVISDAFNCPVVNTYGMSELVCGASECEQGSMHCWPEAGIIEVMEDRQDKILPTQSTGRIIATGLLNFDMPLIRYETGDRGSLKSGICTCGRQLPMIYNIEGRIDDVIVTPDGRTIGRLDPVFKVDIPIIEAQIIQEKTDTIRIKFIPGPGYNHDQLLSQRLKERLGKMNFIFEPVVSIPRGSNGKFQAVISKVQG